MISQYYRSLKDPSIREVDNFPRGVWVHAEQPSPDEITHLSRELSLDEGLLQDAADFYEVPRFEHEENVSYLYTRFVHQTEGETTTSPILIAVGPSFVLTITLSTPAFIEKLTTAESSIVTTQKSKLFLELVNGIMRRYTNELVRIRRDVRKNRRNIRDIKSNDIIRFVSLEDTLNEFISALVPTNSALSTMLSGNYLQLFEDDEDLVEDLQLAGAQVVESARNTEQTIINIRSTYNTIINNNLNQTIKVLTALTIVLTIPTVISSIFGMNVTIPGVGSPFAFWLILMLTAAIAGTFAWYFVKKEWL